MGILNLTVVPMTLITIFSEFFKNIYRYREYLKQSVARDLRKHYKRSVLGYAWSMLNPLFMMIILTVVFSHIMRFDMDSYAVFLFAGMIPWAYFNSTSLGSLGSIRANASIIDQIPVPKYIFPLSLAFSNFVNFFMSLVTLLLIMVVLGRPIHPTILALPLVVLPLFFLTIGLSLILAVSNVFFEDTQHLGLLLLQALYFLSPVLYSRDHLPDWITKWTLLNPMFALIEFTRGLFYDGSLPIPKEYALNMGSTLLILFIGLWIFKKAEDKFVYFM